MRVYCKYHGEMEFTAGGSVVPAEGITFRDGYGDFSDEVGSSLILEFPAMFRQTKFEDWEMLDNSPDGQSTEAVSSSLTVDQPTLATSGNGDTEQPTSDDGDDR